MYIIFMYFEQVFFCNIIMLNRFTCMYFIRVINILISFFFTQVHIFFKQWSVLFVSDVRFLCYKLYLLILHHFCNMRIPVLEIQTEKRRHWLNFRCFGKAVAKKITVSCVVSVCLSAHTKHIDSYRKYYFFFSIYVRENSTANL
jgi:hypothetical protein